MIASLETLTEANATPVAKLTIAAAYGLVSLAMVFVNKLLFTYYGFNNFRFLCFAQCVTTVAVMLLMQERRLRAHRRDVGKDKKSRDAEEQRHPAAATGAATEGGGTLTSHHAAAHVVNIGVVDASSLPGAFPLNPPQLAPSLQTAPTSLNPPQRPPPRLSLSLFGNDAVRRVMPLPLLFLANTVSGLGATQHLTMPMFVLLRRFSIVMTLGLEWYILRRASSPLVKVSVALMIVGALVAAWGDLSMDVAGYAMILANDLFTALTSVVARRVMDAERRVVAVVVPPPPAAGDADERAVRGAVSASRPTQRAVNVGTTQALAKGGRVGGQEENLGEEENSASSRSSTSTAPPLGTEGVLFYNSLLAAPGALLLFLAAADERASVASAITCVFAASPLTTTTAATATPPSPLGPTPCLLLSPGFLVCLMGSMLLGFVLNAVYYLCNRVNSPLTTAVVGSMKNVVSAYLGMLLRDYHFTWLNFTGVNVSVVATVLYSYQEIALGGSANAAKRVGAPPSK